MKTFKGWAIPGPEIPESDGSPIPEEETLDALSGFYKIYQLKKGHRFSTDDLLVAWYGTRHCPRGQRALDLGSGIGTVAQICAFRWPGCHFVTVEAQAKSVELAEKSIRLNGLQNRFDIRLADFRETTALRPDETFDLVTGSPPYFPLGTGALSDHPQKVACRFETRGNIADYCKTASQHLAPSGVLAFIFVEEQDSRAREAITDSGLCLVQTQPVILKEDESPLLRLYLCMKQTHLPAPLHQEIFEEEPLIIRNRRGEISPQYMRIKMALGFPPT